MGKWTANQIVAIVAVILLVFVCIRVKADVDSQPNVVTYKPAKPKRIWNGVCSNMAAVHDRVGALKAAGYQNIRVAGANSKSWGDDFYVIGELY